MRIAVIGLRGFPRIQGGVESHCENIISRLAGEHHCIVYRRKPYVNDEAAAAKQQNLEFIDLPSTRIKGFEALFHTFISSIHIILHRNADVVNIHNIGPGLFTPLLRLFGYKVVLTYHSPNYEHAKWGWFSRKLLKLGETLSLTFASRIIFVNKFQLEKYSEAVKSKSVYIPNGINNVTPSENTGFLDRYGIVPRQYVLAVGRLTPEKGFDTLIDAINKSAVVTQLVIAGSADHNPAYLDCLKHLDVNKRVIFTGFTSGEDLRQLYSHARLFVLSSNNEGFPIVLLEAMSYKLPLVVTDIPATHLIELPLKVYTPAGQADTMAQVIDREYECNDGRRVSYDGIGRYDWKTIAGQTNKIYKSLV